MHNHSHLPDLESYTKFLFFLICLSPNLFISKGLKLLIITAARINIPSGHSSLPLLLKGLHSVFQTFAEKSISLPRDDSQYDCACALVCVLTEADVATINA